MCHFEKKYEIMANKTFIVPILFFFQFLLAYCVFSLKLSYYQKWKYNIYTYWHKFFFWFLFKFKKCRQRKVFQTRLLNRIIVSKVVRILRVNHIHLPQGMYKNWVENKHVSKQWIHRNEKNSCNENSLQWKGKFIALKLFKEF